MHSAQTPSSTLGVRSHHPALFARAAGEERLDELDRLAELLRAVERPGASGAPLVWKQRITQCDRTPYAYASCMAVLAAAMVSQVLLYT